MNHGNVVQTISDGVPRFSTSARARDFNSYFEGESAIPVATLEDVRHWLADCEYESDPHLSRTPTSGGSTEQVRASPAR